MTTNAAEKTAEKTNPLRILPVDTRIVVYPEHGTGRSARMDTCVHCGGKPLIIRKCTARRMCAVCSKCGYHHRIRKLRN
ncbi:MAG TPA: hypothetical protein VFA89_05880 [Terriglobales bacterium]|nr:hypothetical protein [Terriglobales bacterium]